MIDYNDIKQTIAENLPDNNRREITAARLRDTLDGFVDKVQETEAGLEGKVSANETNIGNLSGRVDNLSGEVSGLSGRVDDLSGSIGNVPRIVDNPIKGGVNDVASVKWDTTIAAIAGLYTAEYTIGGNSLKVNKVSVIDGSYIKRDGTIVQLEGYSYFEYTLLEKNGYITIPAYEDAIAVTPNNDMIYPAFYDKDGNVIQIPYETLDLTQYGGQFSGQREIKVPYGATMIRVPLINGTFDPDSLYVVESAQANNCNQLYNLRRKFNECTPTVDHYARIGTNGKPVIDGANWLSVIKLLAGDELEVEIGYGEGVQLAVGSSSYIDYTKTVIYREKPSTNGLVYYKADKDCYAFISESSGFKVVRGDRFDRDIQYEMAALTSKIRPVLGRVIKDSEGKGIFVPDGYGVSGNITIVFKVPVVAGTTLNYTLHYGSGFKIKGDEAYWYSGQPTPTASVGAQVSFNGSVLSINNTTSNKSGYMLISFYFEETVSEDELLNSVYLSKNA